MAKRNKKKELRMPQYFSCPFGGPVPYMRVMTDVEKQQFIDYMSDKNGNPQFAAYFDGQGQLIVPKEQQEFKPSPCFTSQQGEILRCRFYQPTNDIVGEEDEAEADWACLIFLDHKTSTIKNLGDIEKNELEIEVLKLQIDDMREKMKMASVNWEIWEDEGIIVGEGEEEEEEEEEDEIESEEKPPEEDNAKIPNDAEKVDVEVT
jgi:hypothetical protein